MTLLRYTFILGVRSRFWNVQRTLWLIALVCRGSFTFIVDFSCDNPFGFSFYYRTCVHNANKVIAQLSQRKKTLKNPQC